MNRQMALVASHALEEAGCHGRQEFAALADWERQLFVRE